ncbi:hypothetical protein ACLB2K_070052 [Fragaria x ananassa]
MGKKAKTSRKGKKAWRANISTEDIHDFFEKSTKDALSGGNLSQAPDEALFFVDNSKDISVKRKIEKHREKVLHLDSVLQKNPFVKAVHSSTLKKSKKKRKQITNAKDATECGPEGSVSTSGMSDLWSDKGGANHVVKKHHELACYMPVLTYNSLLKMKPSPIPAVEVEPPGCSYNPTDESHQEALAHAVADEMQKVYRNELGPEPVPLTVPGEAIDEEEMYFIEADEGSDDDMNPENLDDNEGGASEKRPFRTKRVTTVELNKRARRKEQLKREAEVKKVQKLSKEIDSLPDIIQEIAKEDEEKQKRHLRHVVATNEKSKSCPPRLGRHKFEPAPVQVLLTEERTGSIRKLKGCCTLVKDRYKSFEKRGLIPVKANKSMRALATKLSTCAKHYCTRNPIRHGQPRNFSSFNARDELSLEQEADRKIGWLLKLLFAGTATAVAYNIMPYMGENLLQQSLSLLQVKDPLFKRMGASRLAQFAVDDERRMKIVEMGGAQELINMLGNAKDDKTRKEALKALSAISQSDQALGALHQAGAISIIRAAPDSLDHAEIKRYKLGLLQRFEDMRYDIPPQDVSTS